VVLIHIFQTLFQFGAGDGVLEMVVRSLQDPLEDLVLFVAAVVFMLLSLLVESKSGVVDEVALGVVIVYLEFGLEFLV